MPDTVSHFIVDDPANGTCRYIGHCDCGEQFSTNSKAGYSNSTRAHLRRARASRAPSAVQNDTPAS